MLQKHCLVWLVSSTEEVDECKEVNRTQGLKDGLQDHGLLFPLLPHFLPLGIGMLNT